MPTEKRVSKAQRIRTQHLAEREVMRFAGDHALWHKHVHNIDLDPMQILKMKEMDEHEFTVDFSSRRTGKTTTKELWLLEYLATHPDQELGIVAPREAQAVTNIADYHLDAIRRSQILTGYLMHKSGRQQMSDTYYQFANRSRAKAYGIFSQVDGGDLTCASLEEVDDMPRDRLFSRFLLMLAGTRRLGARKDAENSPRVHITGVYKGADTLSEIVESGNYQVLPTVDCYLGMEMGILQQAFIQRMQGELAPDEYIRQLLCRNVSAKHLIWEKFVRRAMQVGLEAGVEIAEPIPGATYRKRGLIGLGYDAGGHGEQPDSSKHALVIAEQLGNWVSFPYVRTWAPGADDNQVMRDILSIWEYFRPDYAIGDAYGVGMISTANDALLDQGLIDIDRRTIGDGESTASTWPEWAFSPLRFEGMAKHQMAQCLRALFHHGHAVIPYFGDDDNSLADLATAGHRQLVRQLPNIRAEASQAAYPKYRMVRPSLGDDTFDAAMAAVWSLATRGSIDQAPPVILTSSHSRQKLLGAAA